MSAGLEHLSSQLRRMLPAGGGAGDSGAAMAGCGFADAAADAT